MRHLVIGNGEIGKALAEVLGCDARDTGPHAGGYDVIHICFPYSESFAGEIERYRKEHAARIVVVHSTVPVGTCRSLGVNHSPVTGVHPHLAESIRTFRKPVGGPDVAEIVPEFHLRGIPAETWSSSDATEAGKLYALLIYGVNVLLEKEAHAFCAERGIEYADAYGKMVALYNDGYEHMGMPHFRMYTLEHREGGLGGHCVTMGATHLFTAGSKMAKTVLSAGYEVPEGTRKLDSRDWLFCEYWGKDRSSSEISEDLGVTGACVLKYMKKHGIPRRDQKWTAAEVGRIVQLCDEGKNFREISEDDSLLARGYNAIRLAAAKMGIASRYDPSIVDDARKRKISASLKGIKIEEWVGFYADENSRLRNNARYAEWRTSVFTRDGFACVSCGNGGKLEADHIVPFCLDESRRFDVGNGQTLCPKCHKEKTREDMKLIAAARRDKKQNDALAAVDSGLDTAKGGKMSSCNSTPTRPGRT